VAPATVPRRPPGLDPVPASFAQERLWFLDRLMPGSPAYNLPNALRLLGELSPGALEAAFGAVVRRHESLRTTFRERDGHPEQVIAPPGRWALPRVDLAALPEERRAAEARRLAEEEAVRPFDLARGPLLRTTLLRLGAAEHGLLLAMHHIVSDGWSMGVLVREVALAYAEQPLPELPIQYADFAVWQRGWLSGEELERQLSYWRRQLAGVPASLDLPADRPRPALPTQRGARLPAAFDPALAAELGRLSRGSGSTLFMVLLAGFQALLRRLTGRHDVPVGSPIANRNRAEIEPLIGFFVNTLVLRGDLAGDPSFGELLARVRRTTLDAYAHQDLPFEQLVEELRPQRHLAVTPLFQVLFTLQNTPFDGVDLPGLSFAPLEFAVTSAQFDLELIAWEAGGTLATSLTYSSELFDGATIRRLARSFETLLRGALADPGRRLSEVSLLAASERAQVLREWNDTRRDDGRDLPLHRLVAERAAADPHAMAVVSAAGEALTYGELGARAARLARRLRALGIGPETRVAIAAGRTPGLVVGMLAILEAGGSYVPVDPDYPAERVALMLEDSGAALLLADPALALPDGPVRRVDLHLEMREALEEGDGILSGRGVDPAGAAYVIYTSGSTGRPKGVVIPHRSVSRFVRSAAELYRLSPGDRLLQFSSLGFDTSVVEIWATLAAGATLVLRSAGAAGTIPGFLAEVERLEITVLSLPTAFWHELVDGLEREETAAVPSAVRLVVIGGEEAQARRLATWLGRGAPRLLNAYGPTETTVGPIDSTLAGWGAGMPVPIGRPIDGARASVVDTDLAVAPIGVWGELLIGGVCVARGYLGRPRLTAERFVPDAWSGEPGARVYRTGDLVRFRPDGELQYGGRIDQQVKVRGFRIEPGEIETALAAHPGLRDAAVVARRTPAGDTTLLACVVASQSLAAGAAPPEPAELRAFLTQRLPAHMVPGAFVFLPGLPLTPNGKVDRGALARLEPGRLGGPDSGITPPRTPEERVMADLWREVLGVGQAGVEDNFFDLGGHSLLATQLISRVRSAFGVDLPLRKVFESVTLGDLTAAVAAEAPAVTVTVPRRRPDLDPIPASYAQERLWFLDRLMPGNTAYNIPNALRLLGNVSPAALEAAFGEVVRRHEALRTTFRERDGHPEQVIAPPRRWVLPQVDLAALPEEARAAEARRLAEDEALRPFDLARGPLLRATLLRLGAAEHGLLLIMHHIVSDGWSMGVLIREVALAYARHPLPELPIQYADFAVWQRAWLSGGELERQLSYWRQQLAGVPASLDLPADRPRPALPAQRGARLSVAFDPVFAAELERLSRASAATPFMVLLAAFQALLGRLTGQRDLAVGSPVANRNRAEIEPLIGVFVNTLVLRGDLAGEPSFGELLGRARQTTLDAYAHQDLPFEQLVEELRPQRHLAVTPLFQVLLTLQNTPFEGVDLPGLSFAPLEFAVTSAQFDLELTAWEAEGALALSFTYSTELFDAPTVRRLAGSFETLLRSALADPGRRLSEVALLAESECAQVLREWNDTRRGDGRDLPLHRLVAERVAADPRAVAVVSAAGEALTYGELAARAARLARRLRALGVGPETRVAIAAGRTPGLVVGMLAILEAGGAYVPVDPDYPAERVALMLEDSGAALLLTDADLAAMEEKGEGGGLSGGEVDPAGAAYVIYTSGSTGRPKGVVIPHRAVSRYVRSAAGLYRLEPGDRLLQFSSLGFDTSVDEIWTPLVAGATLVLRSTEAAGTILGFLAEAERLGITVLSLPTAFWHELADSLDRGETAALPPAVRLVVIGGEEAQSRRVASWRRSGAPRLLNSYGPTETTVGPIASALAGWDAGMPVPIGRPVDGARASVVDTNLAVMPIGVWGELLIGGVCVARGYLGRPRLTAERFLPDAWGGDPGARVYRTGDLARFRPDGELQFGGRIDQQVKVRGFRIEPEEIEAALAAHPGLRDAAVVARRTPAGDTTLLACVVASENPGTTAPEASELRAFLAQRLPAHMIPGAFVSLPGLPVTPNGKVDRGALARLEPGRLDGPASAVTPPRTPEERAMADLWREVLGVEQIGVEDNFFDLGGHSLFATQLVSRLRSAFGVDLPLRKVFESATLGDLVAAVMAEAPAAAVTVPRRSPDLDPVPASYAQERLWFLDRLMPGNTAYNIPTALRLLGDVSPSALEAVCGEIVRRHEALRTTFEARDGLPVQVVAPPSSWTLPRVDLAGLPEALRASEVERLAQEELQRPFDLARGPLVRAALFGLAPRETGLVLVMHHIISDGWSTGVLVREVTALYAALLAGANLETALPELPIQYADFAVWQRGWLQGGVWEEQIAYWRRQLAGVPTSLDLATDRPRPAVPTYRGGRASLVLDPALTREVGRFARAHDATPSMVLLAAFQALLGRLSGQLDLAVGSPIANRNRAEIEPLIGFFVNTLVLRGDLSGDPPFRELLARVRQTTLDAWAHQDLPFEHLVEELRPERHLAVNPLFQVVFAMQNAPSGSMDLPGVTFAPLDLAIETAQFDIDLNFWEAEDSLVAIFGYSSELFDATTIRRLASHLEVLLRAALADADRRLPELPLLTAGERQQLLHEWSDTAAVEGEAEMEGDVVRMFARQAARAPGALAVAAGEVRWTYADLAARASRLAGALRELGAAQAPVGLLALRSPELVLGALAVLMAGEAYAPLDPASPPDRLAAVARTSGMSVLLSAEGEAAWAPAGVRVLTLSAEDEAEPPAAVPAISTLPEQLAYVIHTSGSTGLPKGVQIPHAGLTNLVRWHLATYGVTGEDRATLLASPSFDASVWEIWPYLAAGASLHIPDEEVRLLPERLLAWLAVERITLCFLPTPLAEQLVEAAEREVPPGLVLRALLTGGDRLQRAPRRPLPFALINHYGPTESSVVATRSAVPPAPAGGGRPPVIGRPVRNGRALVLDSRLEPVPAGVPGELALGGTGLARGYLGRPDLTAAQLIPDPFAARPGERLYRTGDRVRWLADGELDFMGRIDTQVKLRGFRIELGEIEAVLAAHERVREAVVAIRHEAGAGAAGAWLTAYVVPRPAAEGPEAAGAAEHIAEWQELYDETYDHGDAAADVDPTFDIQGWNSSYTGEPIPAHEMREWVERTVERLLALPHRRVREVGCGTGLLLFRVAPHAERYQGIDFSRVALQGIRRRLAGGGLPQVELAQAAADDWSGVPAGALDLVVVNSVAQYFPGVDYLVRVLAGAVRALAPGGALFVGDVRSRPLLAALHVSVELFRAPSVESLAELRRRLRRRLADEEELVVDPVLFLAAARRLPGVGSADLLIKRGRWHNELTRFRYDAVLRLGAAPARPAPLDGGAASLDAIERRLAVSDPPAALAWAGLANARLAAEAAALELLADAGGAVETVGELRRAVAERTERAPGIDPEDLWALGDRFGYEVELTLDPAAPFHFGAVLRRRGVGEGEIAAALQAAGGAAPPEVPDLPWSAWANDPLRGELERRLVPELQRSLRDKLPDYMVPSAFVLLDALPLNVHGKVDRAALPESDAPRGSGTRRGGAPPRTPAEEAMAALWREVLGVDEVGREDNFFELGGHSLLATQLVSRVRAAFGVGLPLRRVFELPTLGELAAAVAEEAADSAETAAAAAPIPRRPPGLDPIPASFAQERLWFLDRLLLDPAVYNISLTLRLLGGVVPALLEAALREVVRRHEALRTTFHERGERPAQVVAEPGPGILPVVDLGGLPEERRETEMRRLAREEAGRPFDLERGPLLRAALLALTADEHVLLASMHHIVSDGWSMGVLIREVTILYSAALAGRPSPLPELAIQYPDFAVWQRGWLQGGELESQLAYWRGALAGIPSSLDLPADRPRPALATQRGARVRLAFGDLTSDVVRLARRSEATLFMVLLAAFQALLGRLTGQEDIPVGSPIANRHRAEVEPLIGFFVNTLVLRGDLSGDPPFGDLLARVRRTTLDAYAHQDVPFETLVTELNPERHLAQNPLFQVMLSLQNAPLGASEDVPELRLEPVALETETSTFDLVLNLGEPGDGGELAGDLSYSTDLFHATTVARLAGHLRNLLAAVASPGADPRRPLAEIPLLSAAEEAQLLREWSGAVAADRGGLLLLHHEVAARAAADPEALAVLSAATGESLTYGELVERARRLSRRLRRAGVGPEVRVAVVADRSPELIVGLLAVLQAGGAYVPVAYDLPAERLAFMLEDCGAAVVLLAGPRALGSGVETPAGALLIPGTGEGEEPETLPETEVDPANAAYVIYTSGSTGRPKGVVVSHFSIALFLRAMVALRGFAPGDRSLQFLALGFDGSLEDIWAPLTAGATLVLRSEEMAGTVSSFLPEVERLGITQLYLPTSFWGVLSTALAADGVTLPPAVRKVSAGGDAVQPGRLAAWIDRVGRGVALLNLYGPTEATVSTTIANLSGWNPGEPVSIGPPVGGARVYLTDAALRIVPAGVWGELLIGGTGVARGYLGRPELTAERFVPDAWSGEPGARVYRSGDRARFLPDAGLEYGGRLDRQVKIRGFRIELGEIEAALTAHPAVREAAVVARPAPGGDKMLLACVVPVEGEAAPDAAELRSFLAGRLAGPMIPAAFVTLPALPLTPAGKVDRRAISELTPDRPEGGTSEPPRGLLEERLAGLWEGLLGIAGPGRDEDFFVLGGHSLLIIQLISRVREAFGVELPLRRVFETPTIAGLAAWIESAAPARPAGRGILVQLQEGLPGRAPLFCVHPVTGDVLAYRDLAGCLDPGLPVYGIRPPDPPFEDLGEMAAAYLDEIRRLQPAGPYRLLGWSMGGPIAGTMAQQLADAGEAVGLLAIFDTAPPGYFARQPGPEEGRLPADYLADMAATFDAEPPDVDLRGLGLDEVAERLLAIGREAGFLPPGVGVEDVKRHYTLYRAGRWAMSKAKPLRLAQTVHLFRSAARGDSAFVREDPTMGWGAESARVEIHVIPGDHESMLHGEGSEVLAESLGPLLRDGSEG
jgi:amino acid adenylation domain-containing protein